MLVQLVVDGFQLGTGLVKSLFYKFLTPQQIFGAVGHCHHPRRPACGVNFSALCTYLKSYLT